MPRGKKVNTPKDQNNEDGISDNSDSEDLNKEVNSANPQLQIELAKIELERMRLDHEEREKEREERERERQFELEKIRITCESSTKGNNTRRGCVSDTEDDESSYQLEKLLKSVKNLTINIPNNQIGWNMFFTSLERAFTFKKVPQHFQAEILLNILGEKAINLWSRIEEDKIDDYEALKNLVLEEFEPSASECLEQFRNAKRLNGETHVQLASRLTSAWEYYCRLRKITDLESLKKLIVSDRIQQCLESETAVHIGILQKDEWLQPIMLAKACDNYYLAKGKPFENFHIKDIHHEEWVLNKSERVRKFNKFPKDYQTHERNERNKTIQDGCFICKSKNHIKRFCPQRNSSFYSDNRAVGKNYNSQGTVQHIKTIEIDAEPKEIVSLCKISGNIESDRKDTLEIKPIITPLKHIKISVEGRIINALLDSGSQVTVFREDVIPDKETKTNVKIHLKPAFGKIIAADLQYVNIAIPLANKSNVVHRRILSAVTPHISEAAIINPDVVNLLMGKENKTDGETLRLASVEGGIECDKTKEERMTSHDQDNDDEPQILKENANNSERYSSKSDEFRRKQECCEYLQNEWEYAGKGKGNYYVADHLLYHREKIGGNEAVQLVLPKDMRLEVLKRAHETPFGGHMGARKTGTRVRYSFYWEGIMEDVKQYCLACENCQLRRSDKVKERAPITPVVRPELPFQIVNVDLIGPINPPSSAGHKYVLCLIDQHTRWAEAIPLKSLTARSTCDALLHIFSRTGIPSVISSDNGTNFTSELTKEFERRLGASPRFSTPNFPQANGLVERWNQTLKNMLHHVIRSDERGWHKQLPYLLWAYREVPNSTTGVAPFLLLYGRPPEGPLSILKSTWSGKFNNTQLDSTPIHQYLNEMQMRLERAAKLANACTETQQERMAHYYNLRSSINKYKVGEKVIVLIPDSTNKLYARWQGPGTIMKHNLPYTYIVQFEDGRTCKVHQNKIKRFIAPVNALNIIFEGEEEFGDIINIPTTEDIKKKGEAEYQINQIQFHNLTLKQADELRDILLRKLKLFEGPIRMAKVNPHKIELIPGMVRTKPHKYKIPEIYKEEIDKQIEELLELSLIEETDAEIAYPIVCVAKKDGSIRVCTDFRALNSCCKASSFPMKNAQELMLVAGKAKWLTVLDLCKGYHQIPMDMESRNLTAFATHSGIWQWKTMPYGLKTSGATFQHSMNQALRKHQKYAQAYIDDIIIFSNDWEEHMQHLKLICQELIDLNFTARLDKCAFAKHTVKYLGHIIGSGQHAPDPDKLMAIRQLKRPVTKKDVRSVLGLMGFYRSYVKDYALLSTPLTELTKKSAPNKINWNDGTEESFTTLKTKLCDATALTTPDFNKPFQIHTDASNLAVSACLSQKDDEGQFRPIGFASQKLSNTQKNWSTIEKEAYGVLFGLKKFENWIFGSEIELLTDHNPLKFLSITTPRSPKLTRWALALERYNLKIIHTPGSLNRGADAISRLEREDNDTLLNNDEMAGINMEQEEMEKDKESSSEFEVLPAEVIRMQSQSAQNKRDVQQMVNVAHKELEIATEFKNGIEIQHKDKREDTTGGNASLKVLQEHKSSKVKLVPLKPTKLEGKSCQLDYSNSITTDMKQKNEDRTS